MKLFRPSRLSLHTRFVLGLSTMLLPLLLLGAGGLFLLHYVTAATEKVVEESVEEMRPIIHIEMLALMAAMPPNDYLIHGEPAEKEKFAHMAQELDRAFEETLAPSFGLAGEWKLVRAAREEWRLAKAIAQSLLALPRPVGNPAAAREMKRMDGHIDRAVYLLGQVHDLIHRETDEALARAAAAKRWAYALITGIFIAGGAAVAIVAFALARSVLLPLRALESGVSRFGKGDFSHRVELNRTDELGQLANTFNTMAEELENSLAALRIAAVTFETQ
ncbi:MAG: HAMP domain-containing protein [Sulfuricellaceae bacterium]|nr:HAMP domain-containing protein [Sulfuricellaceae bacterium]